MDNLLLVGFGKHDLKDMMEWVDDPEKGDDLVQAFVKWPARYRPVDKCDGDEIAACAAYTQLMSGLLAQYEENENE